MFEYYSYDKGEERWGGVWWGLGYVIYYEFFFFFGGRGYIVRLIRLGRNLFVLNKSLEVFSINLLFLCFCFVFIFFMCILI